MNYYKNQSLSVAFDLNDTKILEYLSYIHKHQINDNINISTNEVAYHHIIPRCWYKQKDFKVDNSKLNVVCLMHKDHCIAHILLAQYYINRDLINERAMLIGMCNAVKRMLKVKSATYPINQLSIDEINWFAEQYQLIMKIYREKWSNLIRITDGINDKLIDKTEDIPNGWHRGRSLAGKRHCITNGTEFKRVDKNTEIPDGWYIGTCSQPCKDTIWINNGTINKRIFKTDIIPEGWFKGQIVKNRTISDNFIFSSKDKKLITDGKKCKFIANDEELPIGWQYGQKDSNLGKIPYNFKKVWITNGTKNKYINVDDDIPSGWYLGLTQITTKPRPKKIWITNGIETLQINYTEKLPGGFRRGRSDIHN